MNFADTGNRVFTVFLRDKPETDMWEMQDI